MLGIVFLFSDVLNWYRSSLVPGSTIVSGVSPKLIDQGLLVEETENPSFDCVMTHVKLAVAWAALSL